MLGPARVVLVVVGAGMDPRAGIRVERVRDTSDACGRAGGLRSRADDPRRMVLDSLSVDKTLGTPAVKPMG